MTASLLAFIPSFQFSGLRTFLYTLYHYSLSSSVVGHYALRTLPSPLYPTSPHIAYQAYIPGSLSLYLYPYLTAAPCIVYTAPASPVSTIPPFLYSRCSHHHVTLTSSVLPRLVISSRCHRATFVYSRSDSFRLHDYPRPVVTLNLFSLRDYLTYARPLCFVQRIRAAVIF